MLAEQVRWERVATINKCSPRQAPREVFDLLGGHRGQLQTPGLAQETDEVLYPDRIQQGSSMTGRWRVHRSTHAIDDLSAGHTRWLVYDKPSIDHTTFFATGHNI